VIKKHKSNLSVPSVADTSGCLRASNKAHPQSVQEVCRGVCCTCWHQKPSATSKLMLSHHDLPMQGVRLRSLHQAANARQGLVRKHDPSSRDIAAVGGGGFPQGGPVPACTVTQLELLCWLFITPNSDFTRN
jgi:hypothetical protein